MTATGSIKANERDSTFLVYIEKDSLNKDVVNLVFENITNDSIILVGHFKNCDQSPYYSPGIKMWFYKNEKDFAPLWGEIRPQVFELGDRRISFSSGEKRVFNLTIPHIQAFYDQRDMSKYDVEFEIYYRYINVSKRKSNGFLVKTNRLNLKSNCGK